jgi:hypothetical protein
MAAKPPIKANGPAIKAVSVAERMEAGAEKLSRGRVLVPAGMSEAWRGFCRPGARFCEVYVFRGTRFIGSRSPISLHEFD